MGDNDPGPRSMTADDQNTSAARFTRLQRVRHRVGAIARRAFLRLGGPFARRHLREVETLAAVRRLQDDVEHIRERHTEQIERLEDLARELIRAVEALRSGDPSPTAPSARALDEDSR